MKVDAIERKAWGGERNGMPREVEINCCKEAKDCAVAIATAFNDNIVAEAAKMRILLLVRLELVVEDKGGAVDATKIVFRESFLDGLLEMQVKRCIAGVARC
jgi:hypothetical protein